MLSLKRHFLISLCAMFYISILIITSLKRRSSSFEVFYKIGVLTSLKKLTEKNLCRSPFLEACNFIKKRFKHMCFYVFLQVFEIIFFVKHLQMAASEKVTIKSSNTARCLSKRSGFLATLNVCSKKK